MTLVRDATLADYDAYVELARELHTGDPVPSRERFAVDLRPRMMIAEDDAGVLGYALVEEMANVGYIRNIVSTPSRRRTGVGVALMEAIRVRFQAAGATTWCLNVMPDNTPAVGLYERFGLRMAYRSTILRLPSSVALPPTSRTLVPAFAEHDAAIEAKFRLLPGQLASARAKSGRHVLQLDEDGVFVFFPAMPGAFPFRLVAPDLAATAIALLRTYAPIPGAMFMQVGVEDDDALVAEVKRLGAYVERELLHLRGAL
jgi:GNAT superfamily N-acetyltransferase